MIQIKNRFNDQVICEGDCSLRELAEKNRANLTGAKLYGAELSGAELSGAELTGADLTGAKLYMANLSGANLTGAKLSRTNLYMAELSGAELSGADLSRTNLYMADLSGARNLPQQFQCHLHLLKWQTGKLIAFKYLFENISPHQNFIYEIGKSYEVNNGLTDERILCDKGINLASLEWCLKETNCDISKTYALFEFDPKDILAIPYNSDGKFRVRKATYIRNLTKEEIEEAIKPLYPNIKETP